MNITLGPRVLLTLSAIMVLLKVFGVIAWSWWIIFFPVWFWLLAVFSGGILTMIAMGACSYTVMKDQQKRNKEKRSK